MYFLPKRILQEGMSMEQQSTPNVSRRTFLKTATAGAAVSAMPSILQAQQAPSLNVIGANDRVRVACVGLSDRFRGSLLPCFKHWQKELNFDMVALADLWSKRRTQGKALLEKEFGHAIDLYHSDEDLFARAKDVDAVIISTADFQHAFHARHAVEAGFDAYCEKPMAEDMGAANALLDAVNKKRAAGFAKGAVLQIGSQRRSSPSYHIANDYIRSGKFGKITYVDLCWNVNQNRRWRRPESLVASLKEQDTDWKKWLLDRPMVAFDPRKYLEFRTFWPYSSGIPGQWMCHQIDTVSWFTGLNYPRSAMASGGLYAWKDGRQNFDTFTTILEYGPEDKPEEGFQAVFSSRQTNSARGNVEKYHSTTGTIDLCRGTVSNEGVEGVKFDCKKLSETVSGGAVTAANTGADPMTKLHMRNWMECVRSRKNPNAPIEAGYWHTVALVMSNAAARMGMRATFDKDARQVLCGGKVFKGY